MTDLTGRITARTPSRNRSWNTSLICVSATDGDSRKIRKLTAEKFGSAPARRTIDRIFERHDLITKKRRRSGKPSHPGKPLTPMDEPNAVWTVDFKGQFKMLNDR